MTAGWTCARCGRTFAHHGQWHSCAPVRGFDQHFANRDPGVKTIALSILRALKTARVPHEIVPVKTRILGRGKRVFLRPRPSPGRLE